LRRIALLIAAFLLAAPPARAAEAIAYYEATWASFPAATMTIRFDDNDRNYLGALHVETVGLPRWVVHFRTEVESSGTFAPDGTAKPEHYNVDYDLRRYRNQHIRVKFVTRDGVLVAERTVDDSSSKPPLEEKYRRDIIDPMSAFAAIRAHLRGRTMKAGDTFTLPVFDDVRRYDVKVTVADKDDLAKLIHVHLDLLPIAGFKDKKDSRGDSEDAPRPIEIVFRDDATMLPTRAEIAIGFLPLIIRFDHLCADLAHCTAAKEAKK
jgi:hypothetical protein